MYRLRIVYKDQSLEDDILEFGCKEVAQQYQKYYFENNDVAYAKIEKIKE